MNIFYWFILYNIMGIAVDSLFVPEPFLITKQKSNRGYIVRYLLTWLWPLILIIYAFIGIMTTYDWIKTKIKGE